MLTAQKMKDCRWLRPLLVAQVDFVQWAPDNRPELAVHLACVKTKPRVEREG
jgi:hypothetical protein